MDENVNMEVNDIERINGQFNSYCFTIRPKSGVKADGPLEKAVIKYLKKNVPYYFLAAEKEDEARHLHGQVWFYKSKAKGDFKKQLERYQSKHDPDWSASASKVLAGGVKIAYSKDFIESYLTKEDNWLLNNPPEDEERFYPSQEEQDRVKKKANATDIKYHSWSVMYEDWSKDNMIAGVTKQSVSEFFHEVMFVSKKIMVQQDPRKRVQMRNCLYYYLRENKSDVSKTFPYEEIVYDGMTKTDMEKYINSPEFKNK